MNDYYNTRYTVSDEMLELCQKDKGTLMSKSDWTKEIFKYISNNNLRNKEIRKLINPDEKLIKLLKLEEKNIPLLSYFNIHNYIKHHFIEVDKIRVKTEEDEPKRYLSTIYVIYHIELENITIFTTNKYRIDKLIKSQAKKYDCLETEFKVKELIEEINFDCSFN